MSIPDTRDNLPEIECCECGELSYHEICEDCASKYVEQDIEWALERQALNL